MVGFVFTFIFAKCGCAPLVLSALFVNPSWACCVRLARGKETQQTPAQILLSCLCDHVLSNIHAYTHIYIYTYFYSIYLYIYIYMYTHIYIHTHTNRTVLCYSVLCRCAVLWTLCVVLTAAIPGAPIRGLPRFMPLVTRVSFITPLWTASTNSSSPITAGLQVALIA